MEADGFSHLTVDGLVTEVGTSRPTFYRRYPSIAHLAFDVIRMRFSAGTPTNTGSLRGDILKLQREEVAMFSTPLLRNNLTGLLEVVRNDAAVRTLYLDNFILPRRAIVGQVLAAAVERGELPSAEAYDVELVCDMLLGPVLARAVLPLDLPISDELAVETAESALRYLHRDAA